MTKSKLLGTACAAAIVAGIAGPAQAADPKWYLTGFGGLARMADYDLTYTGGGCGVPCAYTHSLDNGYVVGGAIGMIVNPGMRVELEIARSRNKVGNDYIGTTFGFIGAGEKGHHDVTTALVNVWFNTHWAGMAPYIGGGVGVGKVDARLSTTNGAGLQYSGDDNGFAAQFGLGIRAPIAKNLELDIGYRARAVFDVGFNTGPGLNATNMSTQDSVVHSFQAGLTFKF